MPFIVPNGAALALLALTVEGFPVFGPVGEQGGGGGAENGREKVDEEMVNRRCRDVLYCDR